MNAVYNIPTSRVSLPANASTLTVFNAGTDTVYVDDQTNVTNGSTPIEPLGSVIWAANTPLNLIAANGTQKVIISTSVLGVTPSPAQIATQIVASTLAAEIGAAVPQAAAIGAAVPQAAAIGAAVPQAAAISESIAGQTLSADIPAPSIKVATFSVAVIGTTHIIPATPGVQLVIWAASLSLRLGGTAGAVCDVALQDTEATPEYIINVQGIAPASAANSLYYGGLPLPTGIGIDLQIGEAGGGTFSSRGCIVYSAPSNLFKPRIS